MLGFNTLKLQLFLLLVVGSSCLPENTNTNRPTDNISLTDAVEATADTDYKPTDLDLKCFDDPDCPIIESGCCSHEKPMAVSKNRSSEVLIKIQASCRKLKQDFINEKRKELADKGISWIGKKIDLCSGREGGPNWLAGVQSQCKKEGERPNVKTFEKELEKPELRVFEKETESITDPNERKLEAQKKWQEAVKEWEKKDVADPRKRRTQAHKKYLDLLKVWELIPGKCTLVGGEPTK